MMPISAALSQDDRDAISSAITTIQKRLPFLVDLVSKDRATLPKMGNKTRSFVSNALEVANRNPDFLPRSFDVDEMRKDLELFHDLSGLLMSLTQLQDMVIEVPGFETSPREVCACEIGANGLSFGEIGVLQIGTRQDGITEIGAFEVCTIEFSLG